MKIAIYGYDTIVGKLVLEELEQSNINIDELYPLSPIANEYDAVPFRNKNHLISYVDEFDFSKVVVALFVTTKDESERLIPRVQEAKCIVIDNSHLYAGIESVPVVLKELNPYKIVDAMSRKLLSVPYAVSSQIALALAPLHNEFGIQSSVVTALVSCSEHGELGTQTLARETTQLLNGMGVEESTDFPAQLAFNVHSRIGEVDETGISAYEKTVKGEVFSLMDAFESGEKALSLNCVQVPTFYGHTLLVHVNLEEDCSLDEFKKCLEDCEYLELEESKEELITPVSCAERDSKLFVSRIRKNDTANFDFVVVMDNTRHGEARAMVDALALLEQKLS